ncbi:MAG: hypothetical protein GX928_02475 [Ruminococcaceae bacterium]|nr:hypothetical protein [Oscillospiraceae bacterium]
MKKLKNTLSRIASIDLRRFSMCIDRVAQESGKGKFLIAADMINSYLNYGIGYFDYLTFGFSHLSKIKRRTFMNMNKNLELVRRLNPEESRYLFENKVEFNNKFKKFLGREYIDLRNTTAEEFEQFCLRQNAVFAKKIDDYGGKGIKKIVVPEISDFGNVFEKLIKDGCILVEEAISQHAEMNRLVESSVNSLRIATLIKDDKTYPIYSLIRMSDGIKHVDNISSGGMYCPVDDTGMITAEAYQDETGLYYEKHPFSKIEFKGFRIPFYDEAVTMVVTASKLVPEIRYVGWDVAITDKGPVLIEANTIPGYDMCQNYRHLGSEKIGIAPKFKEILGDEY